MAYETIINPDLAQLEQWYAQQQRPNRRLADLAQLTPEQLMAMQADNAMGGDQGVQFAAPQQQQTMPENYFQRSGGEVVPLQSIQQQGGMSLDDLLAKTGARIQDKVVMSDRGVGYRTPYGSVAGLDSQGRMWEMDKPRTPAVTPKQMKEYWDMMRAQKDATITPEDEARKVGLVEEAKTEAAKKAAAARAKIPGTIEFKRASELQKVAHGAEATKNYAVSQANEVESALAGILGVSPEELPALLGGKDGFGKAEKRTEAATGVLDVLTPTIFQNTANVEEQTERLRSLSQMMGLTALRKSGVAPGTITEREWPKFGAQLGNLSLRLGDKEFVRELANIYKKTQEMRQTGQLDYEKIVGELQQSGEQQPQQQQPQSATNKSINIPENAAAYLKKNPFLRKQFDLKYGEGASKQVLGQ